MQPEAGLQCHLQGLHVLRLPGTPNAPGRHPVMVWVDWEPDRTDDYDAATETTIGI